jgi:hypothetical protein
MEEVVTSRAPSSRLGVQRLGLLRLGVLRLGVLARLSLLLAGAVSLGLAAGCTLMGSPPPAAAPSNKKYDPPDERYAFFTIAKADVVADGYFSIGYVVALLDADPARRVMVVGHADPHGRPDVNRDLALRRARAVRKILVDHGIKDERIEIAAPRDQAEGAQLESLGRRADLYVFDPAQEDVGKRIGYPLDVTSE